MARRKEACSSVLGLNLCFGGFAALYKDGGFAALYKDPRLRGCAFNMNIQNAVDQHELILIARKGVDALQELATSSATSGRSQKERDRQVAQLHAALVTIHDGLEQTVSKTKGTAGSKYVQLRLTAESKRARLEHGCSSQGSALDGVMDFVRKGISTSDPSELQTPIRGKENRRPQVDRRKTSIAEQEDLIMKQLLNEPESSKLSAAEVVEKLSKLPSGRKRNKVMRDWSSDFGRGVVAMQRSCLVKRMASIPKFGIHPNL